MPLLQAPTPVAESDIWRLSNQFYDKVGPQAWSQRLVPQGVTSNVAIADAYAAIVTAFFRDLARENYTEPPIILEIGGGSGLFAWYFLHRLLNHQWLGGLKIPAFTYLLTDAAQKNIDYWKQQPKFTRLCDQGVLAFGKLLVEKNLKIQTETLGTLTLESLGQRPVVLITNYLHDALPCNLYRVKDHTLYLEYIELLEKESPNDQKKLRFDDRIEIKFTQKPAQPTGHPVIDQCLEQYCSIPGEACISVSELSIQFLEQFLKRKAPLLKIGSDLAYTSPKAFRRKVPLILDHYLAAYVNFHLFGELFQAYGGTYHFPSLPDSHFVTGVFTYAGGIGTLPDTQQVAWSKLYDFTPYDIYNISKRLGHGQSKIDFADVRSWLCLSKFDPQVARDCIPILLKCIQKSSKKVDRDFIRMAYLEAYRLYYPQREKDALFDVEIVELFRQIGLLNDAQFISQQGIKAFGPHPQRSYQLALTLAQLGQTTAALKAAEGCIRSEGDFEQQLLATLRLISTETSSKELEG